ncbi:PREDICTED: uncharacterized protein LOC104735293 [Camelina sativa]|uniref:Uncharacterized protein LOC104735293 n=1 Tax=Camelina sativa TaxID=90675 RepID=A0ABM0VAI6_CAMSA|nr:PREDICTED: uncharacterized protein LOC104735293 [Camelina sativa]
MSGKGFDDDDQILPEFLTLALGWTNSLIYVVTMHLLIVTVETCLFWPLLPNYPHVWGDSVIGMVIFQYITGVIGYASVSHPFTAVAFAMGTKATWFPPLYFGLCSVAYVLFVIVAEFEDDVVVKRFADWISHMLGLSALACLVAIVSVEFAIRLASSTALVSFWYLVKYLKSHETLNPSSLDSSCSSEKLNLVILAALGGAMVFVQIGLAMGSLEETNLSPVYFGVSSVSYVFFRVIEVLEENITIKSVSGHMSRFAGILSLVCFVGLVSKEFALGIFVSTLLLVMRYICKIWCTSPTAEDLAAEVQSLLQSEDLP